MSNKDVFPKPPVAPKRKSSKNLFLVVAVFALLIAIAAIALTVFNFTQLSQSKNTLSTLQQNQQTAEHKLAQSQTVFQDDYKNRLEKYEESVNQLLKQTTNISAESAKGQAHYLIHLAQLNLSFSPDISNSLHLLKLAKQQLTKADSPDVASLIQKINSDIEQLEHLPKVNRTELLATLDNLKIQISAIPLLSKIPNKYKKNEKKEEKEKTWWEHVKSNLAKLKSLVIIRRVDNTNDVALSPDKIQLLKQRLIFKITEAQWAILNNQPELYNESLSGTKVLIDQLNITGSKKQAFLSSIDKLIQTKLTFNKTIQLTSTPTLKPKGQ